MTHKCDGDSRLQNLCVLKIQKLQQYILSLEYLTGEVLCKHYNSLRIKNNDTF